MITDVDERLRDEAKRFHLRFACGDCAHVDEKESRCSLGFPNHEHREGSLEAATVVFCKAFELL